MYDLLKINGTTFPVPEGGFDLSYDDVSNDYDSEAGNTVVEVIREGVARISVKYGGLLESKMNELKSKLGIVNTVSFLKFGEIYTAQMKMSNLSTSKVFYRNGVSVWSLSFELKEL